MKDAGISDNHTIRQLVRQIVAPPVFEDADKTRAAGILNVILWLGIGVDLALALTGLLGLMAQVPTLVSSLAMIVMEGVLLVALRRGYVRATGWIFTAVTWLTFTVCAFWVGGVTGPVPIWFAIAILAAALLVNRLGVAIFTALSAASILIAMQLQISGNLPEALVQTPPLSYGLMSAIVLVMLGVGLYSAVSRLNQAVEQAQQNAQSLAQSNAALETRTRDLEHRGRQLQAAAEVSQMAIVIRDPGVLADRAGHLIREHFALPHAAILLAEDEETPLLRDGEYTHTEGHTALPLRAGTRTIGVLEIELDPAQGVQLEGMPVLQTIADQVAIALENARLLAATRQAVDGLASASTNILSATTQQASGASEQSAAIAQASTTIDEVRTIAEQTAQRAKGVADLAQQVTLSAQSGQDAVDDTIQGMEEIKQKVDSIAHEVLALSEQAQAIGSIISTVGQIASQSNMLALNASVEAARAGEAGRGFAVVASEVRSLAQQSKAATEQVREILGEIQRGVNTAVMATEEGIKGADNGVRLTGQAGQSIRNLAKGITTSTQAAQQIAAAAGQQQAGMEQIAQAMGNIHQVTAQSVSSAYQVEQAAGELNALAAQLRQLVGQYQG